MRLAAFFARTILVQTILVQTILVQTILVQTILVQTILAQTILVRSMLSPGGVATAKQRLPPASVLAHYTIRDLGELPPNLELAPRRTEAAALNARGQVVGTSNGRAFIWEQGRMRDLNTLPGYNLASARAINGRGNVLCVAEYRDNIKAILYADGHITPLGTLGGLSIYVYAMNDRRQVVGSSTVKPDKEGHAARHPFLWESGHMIDLGLLPGTEQGSAMAISQAGQVVGVTSHGTRDAELFRPFLRQNGKMAALPLLTGYRGGIALNINAQGQTVGEALNHDGIKYDGRAVLWDHDRVIDLGTLGGNYSRAQAINERGEILGSAQDEQGNWHPVRWRNEHIEDLGILMAVGDSINVRSINNQGDILYDLYPAKYPNPIRSFVWHEGRSVPVALPPGKDSSQTTHLNASGQVLGDAGVIFLAQGETVRNLTEQLQQRGLYLSALNNRGDFAGHIGWNAPEQRDPRPFLDSKGQLIPLDTLGGPRVDVHGLNDLGQVVGAAQLSVDDPTDRRNEGGPARQRYRLHAFRWQNGKMVDLDGRPDDDSAAWFIDHRGRILGALENRGGGQTLVLWDRNGSRRSTVGEQVTAMNEHDQWCGAGYAGAYRPYPNASLMSRQHAVLWDHGRRIDLSPAAANDETAIALNNRGQVVGQGEPGPFLWQSGQRLPVQSLLPANSGWRISHVAGINDRGQIVGTGIYQGRNRAFIMTAATQTGTHKRL